MKTKKKSNTKKSKILIWVAILLLPFLLIPLINNCLYLGYLFFGVDYNKTEEKTTLITLLGSDTYDQYILKDVDYFNECNTIAETILSEHIGEIHLEDKAEASTLARVKANESGIFNLTLENYKVLNGELESVDKFTALKLMLDKDALDIVGFIELESTDIPDNTISSIILFENHNKHYVFIKEKVDSKFQYSLYQQITSAGFDGFDLSELNESNQLERYSRIVDIDTYNEFLFHHFTLTIGSRYIALISSLIKLPYIIEYLVIAASIFVIIKIIEKKRTNKKE